MDSETKNFIKEEIESLGIMITKAFEYQGKSIEAVEGRLGAVEGRIETVRQELTLEIQEVKNRLTPVEKRLATIEEELTVVKEGLAVVDNKIDRETEMLVVLENTLMDRDLAGEDRTQQVLQRVERIEDHLKLSHSLEPA